MIMKILTWKLSDCKLILEIFDANINDAQVIVAYSRKRGYNLKLIFCIIFTVNVNAGPTK